MKECVCCKRKSKKGQQRMQQQKKKTHGMFIIQEEKQEITISHNMLNSLNDTIAHTGKNSIQCILCMDEQPRSLVSNTKSHCLRFTNRNPFWIAKHNEHKLHQPSCGCGWYWWTARTRLHLKQIRFRGGAECDYYHLFWNGFECERILFCSGESSYSFFLLLVHSTIVCGATQHWIKE